MALLPPTAPGASGAAVVYTQVTAADTFANEGRTMLHVKNPDASNVLTVTVTAQDAASATNEGYLDRVFTVPVSSDRLIPALAPAIYNDAGDLVHVAFTKTGGVTGVLAAVIKPN